MWILTGASLVCELLDVGVHGDELDLRDVGVDHAVDRVEAGAADPDDADDGDVRARLGHAMQPRRRLRERLELGPRASRSGCARAPARARAARTGSEGGGGGVGTASSCHSGTCSTVFSGGSPARVGLGLLDRRPRGSLGLRLPSRPVAALLRSRGTALRAGPHACSRAFAPSSTSFARSRYASAALPFGSYLRTELPFTGASA